MTNTPTTFFGWIIFLIQQYHGYYLQGLLTTLETSLAGTICGCFLGFLVGIIQATDIRAQDNDRSGNGNLLWIIYSIRN